MYDFYLGDNVKLESQGNSGRNGNNILYNLFITSFIFIINSQSSWNVNRLLQYFSYSFYSKNYMKIRVTRRGVMWSSTTVHCRWKFRKKTVKSKLYPFNADDMMLKNILFHLVLWQHSLRRKNNEMKKW